MSDPVINYFTSERAQQGKKSLSVVSPGGKSILPEVSEARERASRSTRRELSINLTLLAVRDA